MTGSVSWAGTKQNKTKNGPAAFFCGQKARVFLQPEGQCWKDKEGA